MSMGRIDTVTESNGPDRFNSNPGCARHHAGVRTGIKDYCCCCDPCNYVRKNESASPPEDRHCCRCMPKLIVAKFTATNGNACCRNSVIPMVIREGMLDGQDIVLYSGSIVGHAITIYILSSAIDSYSSGVNGCSWTISIPSLGVYEHVGIDHTDVTCLGVPAVSITGVTAYEGCIGTVSLSNYSTVKVPFRTGIYYDEGLSITVPFPDGFYHHLCDDLPRYICVTKKWNRQGVGWTSRVRSPKLPWEIEWARTFRWDVHWVPIINENGTPYEYSDDWWLLGRWTYTSEDETAFVQHLWLIQDYSGECFLQPDFESPQGDLLIPSETYERVPLSSCGCDFKILDVRPVNDPSPPPEQGRPDAFNHDLLGIDYRGGACGCWDYHCGKRRCVPRCLCGFLFVNGTLYKDILFTWSNTQKCWVAGGGVDLDGYAMPFDLSICLGQNEKGECQLSVSYEDYDIAPQVIGDLDTVLSGTLQGRNYASTDYFVLNFVTAFDCQCKHLFFCVTATPCNTDCGSHPEILYLTLRGWSEATDIPAPPVTGSCTTDITLFYTQTVVVSGSGVLFGCQYMGYKVVSSTSYDQFNNPTTEQFLIKATLSLGQLRVTRNRLSDLPSLTDTLVVSRTLTETCDPYHGYYGVEFGLRNCWFGNTAIIWHRWEAEVIE
jgi:hypothetical protein